MRRSILTFIFLFPVIVIFGQLPVIHSPTIIPANPGINDAVKIVTHLETPNYGFGVDKQFTVTATPGSKVIKLYLCYAEGMATVITHHIDTFAVGQLPFGTFSVQLNAYMSSAGQHCAKVDSNFSSFTFSVDGPVAVKKNSDPHITKIYPNPTFGNIIIEPAEPEPIQLRIFSIQGQLIRTAEISSSEIFCVEGLCVGLYLFKLEYPDRTEALKVIVSQ